MPSRSGRSSRSTLIETNEVVHQRRGRFVLEGLAFHHVTPVAGRVADRQEDRHVAFAGRVSASVPPRVPVDRVVRVLQQVGTGLVRRVGSPGDRSCDQCLASCRRCDSPLLQATRPPMPMGAEMARTIRVLVVDESPGLDAGTDPCPAPSRARPRPGTGARRPRGPRGVGRGPRRPRPRRPRSRRRPGRRGRGLRSGTARGGSACWRPARQDGPEIAAMALAAGACGVLPHGARSLADRRLPSRRSPASWSCRPPTFRGWSTDWCGNRDHATDGRRSPTVNVRSCVRSPTVGSTLEIAATLSISPLTVQSHVKNILAKLGVHSKVEAVRLAWRTAWGRRPEPPEVEPR